MIPRRRPRLPSRWRRDAPQASGGAERYDGTYESAITSARIGGGDFAVGMPKRRPSAFQRSDGVRGRREVASGIRFHLIYRDAAGGASYAHARAVSGLYSSACFLVGPAVVRAAPSISAICSPAHLVSPARPQAHLLRWSARIMETGARRDWEDLRDHHHDS